MPVIRKLSAEIIGQIAAGEVVERPASAVKELVENSIDAGAHNVTVELREGGIKYLRVTDNGCGIPAEQVRLAFERHATSKIAAAADLYNIHTLGFRGEALASVAAVARVTLTTRTQEAPFGTRAVVEAGEFTDIRQAASPVGTTIVVEDLFLNTPVRLKFLKKPAVEAALVADYMQRLILSRPDVAFRFVSQGKTVYHSMGDGSVESALYSLYGREAFKRMRKVSGHMNGVLLSGYVGAGDLARGNRQQQSFFVNGRFFRSQPLSRALEEGCEGQVMVGRFPMCSLFLEVPVQQVDVNVHPNKLEVRFSDERLLYENVCGAVTDSFSVSPLKSAPHMTLTREVPQMTLRPSVVQVIDTQTEEGIEQAREQLKAEAPQPTVRAINIKIAPPQQTTVSPSTEETESTPTPRQQAEFTSFVTQYFGGAALRENAVPGRKEPLAFAKLNDAPPERKAPESTRENEPTAQNASAPAPRQEAVQQELLPKAESNSLGDELSGYSMVGVAFDTYIILQNQKQLILIDQHAAHERILYEKMMREIDAGTGSQVLMVAQVVHVTPQDAVKIEAYREDIRAAGFDIEPFGDDAYQIRAVPNVLGIPQTKSAFLDMVDRLGELRVLSTAQKRRDAILQMACKKAVKGGDKLTMEEIKPLLADMLRTNAPPTCPHGRPLVVVLERTEIEKRFKRIND